MTTRTSQTIVAFQHPFKLEGVEGELPAGSYSVETEEERIEALSFEAYRRVATTITLPSLSSPSLKRQVVTIDPLDLAGAQGRDAEYVQATPVTKSAKN